MKGRIYKNKLAEAFQVDINKTKQNNFYNPNASFTLNRVSSQPQINSTFNQRKYIDNMNHHSQILNQFQQTLKTTNKCVNSFEEIPEQGYWGNKLIPEATYSNVSPLKMSLGAFQYLDEIEKRAQDRIARIERKYKMVIEHLEGTLDAKNLVIKELKQILDDKENIIEEMTKQIQLTSRQGSARY